MNDDNSILVCHREPIVPQTVSIEQHVEPTPMWINVSALCAVMFLVALVFWWSRHEYGRRVHVLTIPTRKPPCE